MMIRTRLRFFGYLLVLGGLLSACGSSTPLSEEERIATRVAEELAVAATLTASAHGPQASPPPPTGTPPAQGESPEPPTPLPTPTPPRKDQEPLTFSADPTPLPQQCAIVTDFLNLRNGPGVSYNPPITALERGTVLQPVAYSPQGYPGGRWIQVRVPANDLSGWTSADPQFVICNLDIAQLPPGDPPPPPELESLESSVSVNVPVSVVALYHALPNTFNNPNIFFQVQIPGFSPDELDGNDLVFQDKLVFRIDAFDKRVGTTNGAGINQVLIRISNEGFTYERIEEQPAYCFAAGDNPGCQAWVFAEHDYRWPNGEMIEEGEYVVMISVLPVNGPPSYGRFWFRIERPLSAEVAASSGCTIVYSGADGLNLRSGPGTHFDPPITALYQGTQVTPLGRNQDGSWIKVWEPGRSLTGWVKVWSQSGPYVNCSLDIATLPYTEGSTQPDDQQESDLTPGTGSVETALRHYYTLTAQRRYAETWNMLSNEFINSKQQTYQDYVDWWDQVGPAQIQELWVNSEQNNVANVSITIYHPQGEVRYTVNYDLIRDISRGNPEFDYWLFTRSTVVR